MGGSGQPRPPRSSPDSTSTPRVEPSAIEDPLGIRDHAAADVGGGQESGDAGRREACPSNFSAEVTDIPAEMVGAATALSVDDELVIELRDGDPAFLLDGKILGWLAVNIEEVTECLQAGWRYRGIVRENQATPAGPSILTQVLGMAPAV